MALAVGVAGRDCDGLADLGLGQRQGARGGACDVDAARFPLVADGAQHVNVGQGVGRRQGLALRGRAAEGHVARGRVVGVGYGQAGAAADTLGVALAVGVAGLHRDGFADLGLCQHQGAGGRAADDRIASLPLVADGAQHVKVGQSIGSRQGLALRGRAAQADSAGGRIVDVDNGLARC